jgi:type IV pilus assembly protein PilO
MKLSMVLFVALMIGLLGAGYYFVFKPGTEKREARKVEIAQKRKTLNDLKAATSGISDIERKIDELQAAIKFFDSKLPQEKELDKMINEISSLAERNGLQTKTIKTKKIERLAGYSELPVEISLAGDFKTADNRGYYAFLAQLEKHSRITRVGQMKVEKISGREGEMTASMTLSIFFESTGSGGTPSARQVANLGQN